MVPNAFAGEADLVDALGRQHLLIEEVPLFNGFITGSVGPGATDRRRWGQWSVATGVGPLERTERVFGASRWLLNRFRASLRNPARFNKDKRLAESC